MVNAILNAEKFMIRSSRPMRILTPVRRENRQSPKGRSIQRSRPFTSPSLVRNYSPSEVDFAIKKVYRLESELQYVRKENTALRNSCKAIVSRSCSEVALRYSEKRRCESLVKEVDKLQRCCENLSNSLHGHEEALQQSPRAVQRNSRRIILDLVRSNQSLYRHAVFSTKQRILTEQKLLRSSSSHSNIDASLLPPSCLETAAIEDYFPMVAGSSPLEQDFAAYLLMTKGFRPERFIDQFAQIQKNDSIEKMLVEFITREFAALALWTKRVESIVSDIESLNGLSGASIDSTLVATTDTIRKNILCDRVSVWMIDHSGTEEAWTRRLVDPTNKHSPQYEELRIPIGVGLVGACFRSRTVLNIPDAYLDSRFDNSMDLHTGYRTKAVMCVPILKSQGDSSVVISVIQTMNKLDGTPFSKQDEIVVDMFGSVASSVVNHCELLVDQEAQTKRSDLVIECILSYIQHPNLTLSEFFKLTQRSLYRLFRAHSSSLTYSASETEYIRIHLDDVKLCLTHDRTKKDESLTQTTIFQQAYMLSNTFNLHPTIDIPVACDRGIVVHSIPGISGGIAVWVLQFTTRVSSQFTASTEMKHLSNLIACMIPYMKRLLV